MPHVDFCHGICMEVRGQLLRIDSFLPPSVILASTMGCQAWPQPSASDWLDKDLDLIVLHWVPDAPAYSLQYDWNVP